MKHVNGRRSDERRRHHRFSLAEGLVEPITLRFSSNGGSKASPTPAKTQPAVLTDLSASGMSMIVFVEPPHAKTFEMDLNLPGMPHHIPIEARVVRVHSKGETFSVGIAFTRIEKKHQKLINDMASDHTDCETRIGLRLPEACVPDCRFHRLCRKPQKAPHWPPKV